MNFILQENGDKLLQETGDNLVLDETGGEVNRRTLVLNEGILTEI